ncbi:MAG: Rab family GTPase [Promethearchaeota archaeon]
MSLKNNYLYHPTPTYIFKLTIIGDHNVGRNSLLTETTPPTTYFYEDYTNTLGIDIYKKEITIQQDTIGFHIWKVASSPIFMSLTKLYLEGSDATILMFDLTNTKSLDYLSRYPQFIRNNVGDIPILLVGNKNDLPQERTILQEQGNQFARTHNLLGYIEISAKIGQNCQQIFRNLADRVLNP